MIRRTMCTAIALIAAVGLVGTAHAQMKLKAGHILTQSSDQGQAIEFFAKKVSDLTKGQVEVQVFHAGELGKSIPVQLENTQTGAQDFFIDTMDYFKAWDDRFGVMNTPFVFRDRDHLKKFLGSDTFHEMVTALETKNVVFLGKRKYNWFRASDRGVLSRKPVFKPEDLQGMKMRMFQAEVPIRAWGSFGANIQVIPWPDVYTSFATGVVDSLTTVVAASYDAKHTEILKYFTDVKEYFQIVAPIVSKRTWDRFNDEQKKAVEQAAIESGDFYTNFSVKDNDTKIRKAQEEHGVVVINPPLGPWHKQMQTIHAEFEQKGVLPKGLIAQIQAIQ